MNALLAPPAVSPCPRNHIILEPDRALAYSRLAAAIVDVPGEVILAILMSKTAKVEAVDSVLSH
jgi:hypothetical protein